MNHHYGVSTVVPVDGTRHNTFAGSSDDRGFAQRDHLLSQDDSQILTTKVAPRTVRVKILIMVADP